ncbi:MAG: 2-amino-4-hydroxy-6-hydroxymethyldihydropteridine diphosphokinase [Candidatus Sulfotelmatobacter sp.]|jgi:2-amino-4-hydroxy-6-hydroxymethyldihydropteridine diphosphokinase
MLTYLSLGSNVGAREAQLQEAQRRLGAVGRVASVSSYYETEPVGFTEQPWFLNCALALETNQTPLQLMRCVLGIEKEMGRERLQKNGPRTIDIDILLFGDRILNLAEVTIPHPAMHERRFVLEPMAEIAPEARHPMMNRTVRELLAALPQGQEVRKRGEP